jgi:hypothetical protein
VTTLAKKKASFAPYLFDEYKDAVETPMDWDERLSGYEKWSEFKKPYLYNHHEKSERIGDNRGGSGRPFYRPPPGVTTKGGGGKGPVYFPPTCEPKIQAVGGNWQECTCDVDCCVSVTVSCPDAVMGVTVGAQSPGSAGPRRSERDTVTRTKDGLVVTQCGFNKDEDIAIDDRSAVDCGVSCDQPATVSIGYTTKQMSVNGTQTLTATGGIGEYKWKFVGGTGTFSKTLTTDRQGTIYTAPATNSGCSNNPTIQVEDTCKNTATLQIAVNQYTGDGPAVGQSYRASGGSCAVTIRAKAFDCGGSLHTDCEDFACCFCDLTGYEDCMWSDYTSPCFNYTCPSAGGGCLYVGALPCVATCQCSRLWSSNPGFHDIRTPEEVTAGCCPQQLL